MRYSTYRAMGYVGMIVLPVVSFVLFWGTLGLLWAVGLTVLLTAVFVPLQFLQFSRMEDAMAESGGVIARGVLPLYNVVDDELPLGSLGPDSPDSVDLPPCPSCGAFQRSFGGAFCAACGAPMARRPATGPIASAPAPGTRS